MNFLIKLGLIFSIFLLIIIYDYKKYDLKTKQEGLDFINKQTYTKPSFVFKSNEYKEFIYVK